MALICDTSGLFALYDTCNVDHQATAAVVEEEPGKLLVPVLLLVEIDYLLRFQAWRGCRCDFLHIEGGEFNLVPFLPADVRRCGELLTRYRDMDIGLADAAVVATAERLGISRLLCLDQRHFPRRSPR